MEFETVNQQLKSKLNALFQENKNTNLIRQVNKAICFCKQTLHQMNNIIASPDFQFENETKEVRFFKQIKIYPLETLMYYTEIREFELLYPRIGLHAQKKYIKRKSKKINRFFRQHQVFLQYIREERTDMDTVYFTKNPSLMTTDDLYSHFPEVNTPHDILLGKIKAYDRYTAYLNDKLMEIKHPQLSKINTRSGQNLRWTSSKVALAELIYALYHNGALNYGKAEVKQITQTFQKIFQIELNDIYQVYAEIKMRKKSRTKFLDELSTDLISNIHKAEI